jgi:hypothetical protein
VSPNRHIHSRNLDAGCDFDPFRTFLARLLCKPLLHVANVSEGGYGDAASPDADALRALPHAQVAEVSARLEWELAQLAPDERREMATELGLPHSRTAALVDRLQPELGGPGFENLVVLSLEEVNVFGAGEVIQALTAAFPSGWYGGALPAYGSHTSVDHTSVMSTTLSATLADVALPDTEGREVRLGSLWTESPAVLVFLRHYG